MGLYKNSSSKPTQKLKTNNKQIAINSKLNLMSFNIQGMGKIEEQEFDKLINIINLIVTTQTDICAIQETHRSHQSGVDVAALIREHHPNLIYMEKPRIRRSQWKRAWGGTALIINTDTCEIIDDRQTTTDGIMSVVIQIKNTKAVVEVHNAYLSPQVPQHTEGNQLIKKELALKLQYRRPCACTGDQNNNNRWCNTRINSIPSPCLCNIKVVMGDFNARIGEISNEKYIRRSMDIIVNQAGKDLVLFANSNKMIILNGLQTQKQSNAAQYSHLAINSVANIIHRSLIDYAMLSRQHVHMFDDERSVEVIQDHEMNISSDHLPSTFTLQAPIEAIEETINEQKDRDPQHAKEMTIDSISHPARSQETTVKFNTNDKGRENFWKSFQESLDSVLPIWQRQIEDDRETDVEKLYSCFVDSVKASVLATIGVNQQNKRNEERKYMWNAEVAKLKKEKRRMVMHKLRAMKENDHQEVDVCIIRIHKIKNKIKSIVRRTNRERKHRLIYEIEKLHDTQPKLFWAKLKQLVEWDQKKVRLPNEVKNKQGALVVGEEALYAWIQQYQEISRFDIRAEQFDSKFATEIQNNIKKKEREIEEEIENEEIVERRKSTNERKGKHKLHENITKEELEHAITMLKRSKAAGIDNIPNEILMHGGDSMLKSLLILFNMILKIKDSPNKWKLGLIVPIFKRGQIDKLNPNNYRPITLLSCVGKLFALILEIRLTEFCEVNQILSEEQNGFRPDRSCIDNIYTIVELVQTRTRLKKQTILCFIDLTKAYDIVFRDGLWQRLLDVGIDGDIWLLLKNMYSNTQSQVVVNDERSPRFEIESGVRQGDPLSPLLFSIFIDGLVTHIKNLNAGIEIDAQYLSLLLYADDIVLIANSAEHMQIMLDGIHEYSVKWRFEVNLAPSKTAVMLFNCGENEKNFRYMIGDKQVGITDQYDYLGVEITSPLNWDATKTRMIAKANRNMWRTWTMGIRSGCLSVQASDRIYTALVRSQMEYAAEIWGGLPKKKWQAAEKVQVEMGKLILHCPTRTNNECVNGELGWWPIHARHQMLRMRWWGRIMTMSESRWPNIVYHWARRIYEESCDSGQPLVNWASHTHRVMQETGLERIWNMNELPRNQKPPAEDGNSQHHNEEKEPLPYSSDSEWILFCDGANRRNQQQNNMLQANPKNDLIREGQSSIGGILFETVNQHNYHLYCSTIALEAKTSAHSDEIANTTNNIAEYQSLVVGLKLASSLGVTKLTINMDSQLTVQQILGTYQIRSLQLKNLYSEVKSLTNRFSMCKIRHVYRKYNTIADSMANHAIDKKVALENLQKRPSDAYAREVRKCQNLEPIGKCSQFIQSSMKLGTTTWPSATQIPRIMSRRLLSDNMCLRNEWQLKLQCVMQEHVEREWKTATEAKPKLRSYRMIKQQWGQEAYLQDNNPPKRNKKQKEQPQKGSDDKESSENQLSSYCNKPMFYTNKIKRGQYILTMLRCGTNPLRIETGRYENLPLPDRLCECCRINGDRLTQELAQQLDESRKRMITEQLQLGGEASGAWLRESYGDANATECVQSNMPCIEDEFHFVLDCPSYSTLRRTLMDDIYSMPHHKLSRAIWIQSNRKDKMRFMMCDKKMFEQFGIKYEQRIKIEENIKLFLYQCMCTRETIITASKSTKDSAAENTNETEITNEDANVFTQQRADLIDSDWYPAEEQWDTFNQIGNGCRNNKANNLQPNQKFSPKS
jgi:ribonuclease HI/endonuclease/exonuclease/phosphatase family metal-dependent hydrolase